MTDAWELSSDPLEEKQELLTADPSLQPQLPIHLPYQLLKMTAQKIN